MIIGNGQFVHGDALALMRSMPPDCVDMIFTDPPYRVISGGMTSSRSRGEFAMFHDNSQLFEHNSVAIADYMPELFRLLKPGSHCYVMTNNLNLRDLLNVAASVGFDFHNLLVWRKNTCTANRWYMKEMELVCFFYKKPAKKINNAGSKQIFEFDNPKNKRHPTEKPVELITHYIENSTQPGEIVLDPFAGSGSSAIAAQLTGRRWISFESDDTHFYPAMCRIWGICHDIGS